MMSGIPKQRLVKAIVDTIPEAEIRQGFNLLPATNMVERLKDIRKDDLEEFLCSFPTGKTLFQELVKRFPKDMPRTFFLVKLPPKKYTEELGDSARKNAQGERGNAVFVNQKIRVVYLEDGINVVNNLGLLEIPIAYERKIEYQIGDPPESELYGEFMRTYSLEHAYLWLLDECSHGIVCCSDIAALQAIIKYFRNQQLLNLSIPNMTTDIFSRLIGKSEASSATFSGNPLEIPTVTVSARNVDKTDLYQELYDNPEREQTAGFFRDNKGDLFASFGISRQYSRIWTPWHYSKPWLIKASKIIIDKTEEELSTEYESNYLNYISYFSNVIVVVGQKKLIGRERQLFQELLTNILGAHKRGNEIVVSKDFLIDLIERQSQLDLNASAHFDCPNCGDSLARCSDCFAPYSVKVKDGEIRLTCSKCNHEISENQDLICECGTELGIVQLENHIQIYPRAFLQQAIEAFIQQNLDEFHWQGFFLIDGLILKLLEQKKTRTELPGIIRLEQLDLWKEIAQYPRRVPNQKYLKLLNTTKEKCIRFSSPPKEEECTLCKASKIEERLVYKEKQVCLPRIYGLPIKIPFDGIHHGREIADIKYWDKYNGNSIHLGIHLKSRTNPRPDGLGRSVYAIKSLYTQVFYSAYQTLKGDIDFDVIGMSIPNNIKSDVIASIQFLLNKMGITLLILDEDDWLKIFDAALETITFDED